MLVIPTLNDSEKDFKEMCVWIKENLGVDMPVHFTRFHPTYKMKDLLPTPVKTLEMARKAALDTRFASLMWLMCPDMKVKIPIVRTAKTS